MRAVFRALEFLGIALRRVGGVAVAVAAVGIIALLIVPVPAAVLDFLLGLNLSIAVVILLIALWVPGAASFSSFPTVLLLTTLFRLALNICSTRLILSDAEAGVVIETFGSLTVGGNFILGGVVFLIITVVQFVVISKGAERVSEVGARFTLDAMAGKQMAIGEDLRSGLILPEQAGERRAALDRESKLYGPMEGAMKFVKGDAIAGVVISLINIVAGLILGVTQMDMSAAEAAETFTLLTIGDGLVSQVPALLITCAAGLLVTRVADAKGADGVEQQAGGDIVAQFLAQPAALIVAGLTLLPLSLLFGIGLQLAAFVLAAFMLIGVGLPQISSLRTRFRLRTFAANDGPAGQSTPVVPAVDAASFAAHPEPVVLELGKDLFKLIAPDDAARWAAIAREFDALRLQLQRELGIEIPRISCARAGHGPPDAYRLAIFDAQVGRGRIGADQVMVHAAASELRSLGISAEEAPAPVGANRAALISAADSAVAVEAEFTCLQPLEVLLEHCCILLRRQAAEFCGPQEVQRRLAQLEDTHPDLIETVTQRTLTLPQITLVLKRLLREGVPLRDMRSILGALAQHGQNQKHPIDLAEAVRRTLRHTIIQRAARNAAELGYFVLDPAIESLIDAGQSVDQAEAYVGLAPTDLGAVFAAVAEAVRAPFENGQSLAVVTRAELRPFVRALFEPRFPDLHVLSELEVANVHAVELIPRGTIRLPAHDHASVVSAARAA